MAFAFIIATITLSSCYKDYFELDKLSTDINWQPNVAGAGINSTLTIRDILRDYDTNHLFTEDQTNFLYLVYSKRIYSLPAHDIVVLPDINLASQFNASEYISQGFPIPTNTAAVSKNITALLGLTHSETFDSIILKYGVMNVGLNSTFQHNGILTITFPSITMFGNAYTKSIPVTAGVPVSTSFDDMMGYTIDLTSSINQFPVIATYTLNSSGAAVSATDDANLTVSLTGLLYDFIYGNIGNYTINFNPDTVHIEIFDKAYDGYAYFVDPKLKFHMHNSFGVPIGFAFYDFGLYSTTLNGYNTYPFPLSYNPFLLQAPTSPYDVHISSIVLDTTNFPIIRDIIADNPKYIFFGGTGITNPPGTNQYNFITDSSRFSVDLEVELPLWGHASLLALQDTQSFVVQDIFPDSTELSLDSVQWIKFRLNVENGMPLDAVVQVYFADTLGNVYDSLFYDQSTAQIINAGILGSTGRVVASTTKMTDIVFTTPRLQHLKPVQRVLIRGSLKTANISSQQNVRFYSDYTIKVKIGLQAKGDIDIYDLK
ncbi:MAG: hypothetical protein CVU05_09895 [Bacteroidetes bacterium HGW-Bacteroidetes-21]|nr:MAG: hypothetical protein CVU05_09895 [Bacteroidetes bacterium HGW-Bacteroidetes-21]